MENELTHKICITCKENKDICNFQKRKNSKDGFRNTCRKCDNIVKNNWRKNNKEYTKFYANSYKIRRNELYNLRKKNDDFFNLKEGIRLLIINCLKLKSFSKNTHTYKILCCSYNDFKIYIESKFEPWMTWENHGKYNGEFEFGWDFDHIIPLSSAKMDEDLIKLNHYTNFQPLDGKINREIKKR